VRVAAEIGEHLFGAGERSLGVDDPLRAAQQMDALGEWGGLGQIGERAGKAQLTRRECRP
jgi:hypothetical protein